MARSLIPWFGGKNRMAARIISFIPTDHVVYCEPFGGAASVLLNKPRSKVEVYNDLNEGLYSLFTVLSDENHFSRFYSKLILQRWSRQAFARHVERWKCSSDIVERAMAFYVAARQSFGGRCDTFGYERTEGGNKASFLRALDALPDMHERTAGVIIENNDWRKVLAAFDTPQTLFYCDPPYVPATRRSGEYEHEMSMADHEEMVGRLLQMQGRALLSGYPSEVYKPLEAAGWRRLEWNYTSCAAGTTRLNNLTQAQRERTECLWIHAGIPVTEEQISSTGARLVAG
jgi:DNA adenine methylase